MALLFDLWPDILCRMEKTVSSVSDVLKALPAVQRAVRKDIQSRLNDGEQIGSMDDAEMQERSRIVLARARTERAPKKSAA